MPRTGERKTPGTVKIPGVECPANGGNYFIMVIFFVNDFPSDVRR